MREAARALPAAADLDRAGFRAAHIRHAARRKAHVVRCHANRAGRPVKARRAYNALLIDRREGQRIARCRRHENEASVRFDETFVHDRLLHCRLCRNNRDLAVTVKVERYRLTRCEHRCALARNNNPLVSYILAEEGDRPLILSDEGCAVDNFSIVRRTDKGILARHKVRIRNLHR